MWAENICEVDNERCLSGIQHLSQLKKIYNMALKLSCEFHSAYLYHQHLLFYCLMRRKYNLFYSTYKTVLKTLII